MKDSLLTILRDKKTAMPEFRRAAHQLAELMAAELVLSLSSEPVSLETPIAPAKGFKTPQKAVLIPIYRSGIVLLPAFMAYFPDAPVGFFGIRRDDNTAKPIPYYENLPKITGDNTVIILDPMIATAGSALHVLERLSALEIHPSRIYLAAIIGSIEGIKKIKAKYPYINLRVVAEDPSLSDKKFIVPGLGDFGDRYFGTPS